MIAKGKILTLYEPGAQVPVAETTNIRTASSRHPTVSASHVERRMHALSFSDSDTESAVSIAASATTSAHGSNFRTLSGDGNRSTDSPPGEPPDIRTKQSFLDRLRRRLFKRSKTS